MFSDLINADDAVGDGIDGEGGNGFQSEFFCDVLAMGHYGGKAYVEPVGYFLIYISFYDEGKDFCFALGYVDWSSVVH